jgi:hypothetical protein
LANSKTQTLTNKNSIMKKIRISYWTATIIFSLLMFMDGMAGITRQQAGIDVMHQLGYPVYFLSIAGLAKILGAVAIVQNKFKTIKEWAYAGFAINFFGACASQSFAGNNVFFAVFPLIVFAVMLVPYFLWKKYERIKSSSNIDVAIA